MADSFEDFCKDCRAALRTQDLPKALETIRDRLQDLLHDPAVVAQHCGPDAEPGIRTIYRDPETGMNLLVHVYAEGKESPPHDHGESWAVYGQAVGHTDMTLWRRTDDGSQAGKAAVEPIKTYRLDPGMAGCFAPGDIHSIKFPAGARFLRITGTDLKSIATRRFDPKQGTVLEDRGVSGVVRN